MEKRGQLYRKSLRRCAFTKSFLGVTYSRFRRIREQKTDLRPSENLNDISPPSIRLESTADGGDDPA